MVGTGGNWEQTVPNVGKSTVWRKLEADGYNSRKAKTVPYLTAAKKEKRVVWACHFIGFGKEQWQHVIFSDECYICIGGNKGTIYITQKPNEKFHPDCTVPSFTQSTIRVRVWGCIMWGWKGPLCVLEYPGGRGGGMNVTWYWEQVLDEVLLDFFTESNAERGQVQFQQDNAPSHTTKMTKKWFADYSIPLFPHTPSPPDLNPIESVWNELKKRIACRPHPPISIQELTHVDYEEWEALDINNIDKHICTMQDRVTTVINAKGGNTQY